MIELEVLNDIRGYKTKVIGPFTKKEAVSVAISLFIDSLIYTFIFVPFHLSVDMLLVVCAVADFGILALGFGKKMGQIPYTDYIPFFIKYNVLAPRYRKARNTGAWKSIYAEQKTQNNSQKAQKISKKELEEHPEYIAYK